jgi:hypothetical protein
VVNGEDVTLGGGGGWSPAANSMRESNQYGAPDVQHEGI